MKPEQVFLLLFDAHYMMEYDAFLTWMDDILKAIRSQDSRYVILQLGPDGAHTAGSDEFPPGQDAVDVKPENIQ